MALPLSFTKEFFPHERRFRSYGISRERGRNGEGGGLEAAERRTVLPMLTHIVMFVYCFYMRCIYLVCGMFPFHTVCTIYRPVGWARPSIVSSVGGRNKHASSSGAKEAKLQVTPQGNNRRSNTAAVRAGVPRSVTSSMVHDNYG